MGCNNSKSAEINEAKAPESKDASTHQFSENTDKNVDKSENAKQDEEKNSGEMRIDERIMYVNGLSAFARTTMMVAYLCDVKIKYVDSIPSLIRSLNIDLRTNEQMVDWFLKHINPTHTVPVLVDGDMILTEPEEICKHLIDNFGQQKSMNPGGEEAGKMDEIVRYVHETLVPCVKKIVIPALRKEADTVSEETVEHAKNAGYDYFEKLLGESEYLTGANLTWADLLVFEILIQMELHPKYKSESLIISKWFTRIQALPPFHLVHRDYFDSKMYLNAC